MADVDFTVTTIEVEKMTRHRSPRNQLIELIEHGAISLEKIDDALDCVNVAPDDKTWWLFIDRLLLWLGSLALTFSALFFVAYNWNEIGRFTKFGMIEMGVVLAVVAYWKLDKNKITSKVLLFVAAILLGVLLALYGQTYQTGADPWQLFFNWALLILPWVLIGQFPAIWILWISLINLSIVLYHQAFQGALWLMLDADSAELWLLLFFNTVALVVWEHSSERWRWLSTLWATRLLAMGGGIPITWLLMLDIANDSESTIYAGLVWLVWMTGLYYVYRKLKPDLFMLAGGCLSGIVVLTTFFSRHLLSSASAGSFLLLAIIIMGLGAGAAIWLRSIHREWQS